MSFFDDKQEVIKLELTTYGRYLLSKGKLKPHFYAFFDDDILYDGLYANISESQNNIQTRILDETLSLKPQTTYTSIENSVHKNKNLTLDELEELKVEELQISADKNYALSLPLGKSSHSSEYLPSWKLNLTNGIIESVEQYIDNSEGDQDSLQPYLKIPQIHLKDIYADVKIKKNDSKLEDSYMLLTSKIIGQDTYYVSYKEPELVLDISEMNTYDEKLNFDIEIFVQQKDSWKQLRFNKQVEQIKNNFLLDIVEKQEFLDTKEFSEYYFDSTADEEILSVKPISEVGTSIYKSNVKPEDGPFGVDC